MNWYHIIEVTYLGPTNSRDSRVQLYSPPFKQRLTIPYNPSFCGTCDIAIDWLQENGFHVIGGAEGKDKFYIITKTFKSLK